MSTPNTTTVHDRLTRPHPVVVATRTRASQVKPDDTGRLDLAGQGGARIKVSRAALPRALRVLDALFKAAEERGWRVESGRKPTGTPVTEILKDSHGVIVTITEDTTKTPHVPTKTEQREIDRGYSYGIPQYDHEPNGRLTIRLVDCYVAKRSNWSDGVRQRVEDLLDDVLAEVQRAFIEYEERHARREREAQERREREILALEQGYQEFVQRARAEAVTEQARRWRLAEDLRAYAGEVRLRAEKAGETPPEVEEWLDWVQRHLDEVLDPPGRLPALPPTPSRSASSVADHLVQRYGRYGDAYREWIESASPGSAPP